MSARDCAAVEELLPEFALGTLTGAERAEVAAHLERCPSCRAQAAELAEVADAVVTAGPHAEPPLGFESRVLARLQANGAAAPPRRSLRRRLLAAAAAVVIALSGAAAGIALGGGDDDGDGPAGVAVAALRDDAGDALGEVVVFDDPAWMALRLHWAPDGAGYRCEVVMADGTTVEVGRWEAREGRVGWSGRLPEVDGEVTAVRLRLDDGRLIATAELT